MDNNKMIILASASPRRKEIMEKLGFEFVVKISGCEEITKETEPGKIVVELSQIKAKDVADKYISNKEIVVGADTVVAHKGCIMGKPKDEEAAFDMIKSYEGDIHKVYTGVSVVIPYKDEDEKIRILDGADEFKLATKDFFGIENLDISVCTLNKCEAITVSYSVYTDVHVVLMNDSEIKKYANSGEPLDKAGAYAIQGGFAPYISSIQGDYYNVVGLPACSLYALLKNVL